MNFLKRAYCFFLKQCCSPFCFFMILWLCLGCGSHRYQDNTRAFMIRGGDSEIVGFTQMLEKNPQDLMALYARGCSYYNIRKFDEAIADFDKVIAINKPYIPSTTQTKSTSTSSNSTPDEAYKEYMATSEMSRAANIGVGSRTGFVGSLGALGALGSGSGEQPKVNTKQRKVDRFLAENALKLRATASKSKAESFENAGNISEAKSAYAEYIAFYNNLSTDQQKEVIVSEMYRLSLTKIDTLPGKK